MASLILTRRSRRTDLDARSTNPEDIAYTYITILPSVECQILPNRTWLELQPKCRIPERIVWLRVDADRKLW